MRALPRFGPYQAVRELARGGMGIVYEAAHEVTGARHAVKTVVRGAEAEELTRFRREAEVLGRLDHPNVVRVHAAELAAATPWLAQDLLVGGTLADRLARGPLAVDDALDLARKLTDALAHAHARGVLHRDLKPSNVVFDDRGEPRLVDFGLGRALDFARLTATGAILGTPGFMAPELALGGRGDDARTDVYGLGALLYAALTGRPPFEGANAVALFKAVTEEDPTPLRRLRRDAPAWLEALVARALARRPEDRFQDVAALADALSAGPANVTARRGRGLALGALVASAVVVIVAVLATRDGAHPVSGRDVAAVSTIVAVSTTAATRDAPPAAPIRTPATEPELAALEEAVVRRDRKAVEELLQRVALEPADARSVALSCLAKVNSDIATSTRITEDALGGDPQARQELLDYFAVVGLVEEVDPTLLLVETDVGGYQHFMWGVMKDKERAGASLAVLLRDLLEVAPKDVVLLCFDARSRARTKPDEARETLLRQLDRLSAPATRVPTRWLRDEVLEVLRTLVPPDDLRPLLERELELVHDDSGASRAVRALIKWNDGRSR